MIDYTDYYYITHMLRHLFFKWNGVCGEFKQILVQKTQRFCTEIYINFCCVNRPLDYKQNMLNGKLKTHIITEMLPEVSWIFILNIRIIKV